MWQIAVSGLRPGTVSQLIMACQSNILYNIHRHYISQITVLPADARGLGLSGLEIKYYLQMHDRRQENKNDSERGYIRRFHSSDLHHCSDSAATRHALFRIFLLHPSLPLGIDKAASAPRTLISSHTHKSPSACTFGVGPILSTRHTAHALKKGSEEEASDGGPHEPEVVAAQACRAAGGAKGITALDKGGATAEGG